MSSEGSMTGTGGTRPEAGASVEGRNPVAGDSGASIAATVLRVLVPVVLALLVGGLILLALGKDPLGYYGFVLQRSLLRWGGVQETLTRMAPLLLIAAGLMVAFRAGIWNLGGDGQFLLAAVASAGAGARRWKQSCRAAPRCWCACWRARSWARSGP